LLILGLPYDKWLDKYYDGLNNSLRINYLKHHDVTVLALEVLTQTNGVIIANIISNLATTVGHPIQIISDHGPDLKKGIELYLKHHSQTIYTYDFTHQIALWLKYKLSDHPQFQRFLELSHLTRLQIQQTELSFLIPPKARSKARYHNISLFVDWGLSVINYWKKQDFSLISNRFIIDRHTLYFLQGKIQIHSTFTLLEHYGFSTDNFNSFAQFLLQHISFSPDLEIILNAANLGRRRFLDKFEWLLDYETLLQEIAEYIEVFNLAKHHFSLWGLHRNSVDDWFDLSQDFIDSPHLIEAVQRVHLYLTIYTRHLPSELILPATSDIIESLFGKYKTFVSFSPSKEINEMILSLVLSTIDITPDLITQALNSITTSNLNDWIKSTFSPSFSSQRKQAFDNS